MSFVERLEKLDREIADAVEAGLGKLRAEIEERLQVGHAETLRQVRELHAELPGAYVPFAEIFEIAERERPVVPAVEPIDEKALAAEARGAGHSDLHAATVAIDRARSQGDILSALLAETPRFASRAVLLLLRPDGLAGWGSQGFAQERVAAFTLPRYHALTERMIDGSGTVALTPADCAEVASQLDGPAAREGVLIPVVLRDRVTAALYADALDGQALESAALQTLAHLVALSIETLPFRERAATATLRSADSLPREAPPAALAPTAPAEPTEVTEPTAVAEPPAPEEAIEPAATQALSVPEPEPEPPTVEPTVESIEPSWAVEPVEIEPEEIPEGPAEVEAVGVEALGTGALEIDLEPDLPAIDLDATAVAEPVPVAWQPGPVEPPAFPVEPPAFPAEPDLPAAPYLDRPAVPAETEPVATEGHETVLLRTIPPPAAASGADTAAFADLPADLPEPALPEPQEGDSAHAEPLRAVPAGPDAPRTAEVRPPSGVQGPGWAFSTGRMPAISLDDEPVHEEARRLARLLVSEIKLYNEEQVEEGRRNRDIYERLKEDIDRSRQMYEDRVDPKVVATTDYFYQELVRILAAGDSRALGI